MTVLAADARSVRVTVATLPAVMPWNTVVVLIPGLTSDDAVAAAVTVTVVIEPEGYWVIVTKLVIPGRVEVMVMSWPEADDATDAAELETDAATEESDPAAEDRALEALAAAPDRVVVMTFPPVSLVSQK